MERGKSSLLIGIIVWLTMTVTAWPPHMWLASSRRTLVSGTLGVGHGGSESWITAGYGKFAPRDLTELMKNDGVHLSEGVVIPQVPQGEPLNT